MKLLEERIIKDGHFAEGGVLKVDSFLNHQMDIGLINEIGKEFRRLFNNKEITKILTIEASGIGIACIAAQYFNVPVVFAKKVQSKNLDGDVYTTNITSFTHGKDYTIRVSKKYITKEDKVLIIDDFLAKGKAMLGLIDILNQAGAEIAGAGICIEKEFQDGGRIIRDMGIDLKSLAIISLNKDGELIFK